MARPNQTNVHEAYGSAITVSHYSSPFLPCIPCIPRCTTLHSVELSQCFFLRNFLHAKDGIFFSLVLDGAPPPPPWWFPNPWEALHVASPQALEVAARRRGRSNV